MQKKPKVGEVLLQAGVIDRFQLEAALGDQKRWGRPLGAALIKLGFIDEYDLVRGLASQLNLSVARLRGKTIASAVIAQVPPSVAVRGTLLPLFIKQEGVRRTLYIGVEDPANLDAFDDLSFRTGMDVQPVMVAPSELQQAINRYYDSTESDEDFTERMKLELNAQQAEQSGDAAPETRPRATPKPAPRQVSPGAQALADGWKPDPETELQAEALAAGESSPAELELSELHHGPELSLDDLHTEVKLDPYSMKSRIMIHAMVDLLIEKGVLTREELEERVRVLRPRSAPGDASASDDTEDSPSAD
jgi:hypothetical protein